MKKKLLFDSNFETNSSLYSEREDIAIIGMALRLPDAEDEESLIQLLRDGSDRVRDFPASRAADVDKFVKYFNKSSESTPRFFRGAWLDSIDQFNHEQFRMSKVEANLCDPHQRLFLQVAWEALNNSGYGGEALKATRTAVFVCGDTKKGISYLQLVTEQAFDMLPLALTGNNASYTPARLSYIFDFQGPASVIDTGCCSSLVGIHQACQGLLNHEYEYAIVGSSELNFLPLDTGLRVGIESVNGATCSFSADATGTGLGEGGLCVVLKRLTDALEDRDAIHAVIRSSAVNHSGRAIGLTVPTSSAQADVVDEAWRKAEIHPDELGYIEAHGTATSLGDPIEFDGLIQAFRRHSTKKQTCAIGTFKSQIGHLMNSAGLAGLVKAIISVKHGEIFPSLHFRAPNTKIDFLQSPFYINDRHQPWLTNKRRLAGVSSYSMTGINCHVVVEEPPNYRKESLKSTDQILFPISATSPVQLKLYVKSFLEWLQKNQDVSPLDIAFTLSTGREHDFCRCALLASSTKELIELLTFVLEDKEHIAVFCGDAVKDSITRINLDTNIRSQAEAYIAGGIPIIKKGNYNRLHLPYPPMESHRYWLDSSVPTQFEKYSSHEVSIHIRDFVQPWLEKSTDKLEVSSYLERLNEIVNSDELLTLNLNGDRDHDYPILLSNIQRIFSRKLGLPDVDLNSTITDLGGNSMTVIQLVADLKKYIPVTLSDVYACPTVVGLTNLLLNKQGNKENRAEIFARRIAEMDVLIEDRRLLESQYKKYKQQSSEILKQLGELSPDYNSNVVLLTGSTGFLGSHFLHKLTENTEIHVILIVRAKSNEEALERVQSLYKHQHGKLLSAEQLSRIEVLCGDVAEPQFGLTNQDWQKVISSVEDIIHLAARVKHSGEYSAFEHDNVTTVEQIIACAAVGRTKRIHFASSTAVAHGNYAEEPLVRLYTEFDREVAPHYNNPYSRSKVEAEQLLETAKANGVVVNIYRFGNVLFHSNSGQFQRNVSENGIYTIFRAFIILGCYPDSARRELDFGFVNEMTDAFFKIYECTSLNNGVYHLFNPNSVSINDICTELKKIGYPLERLTLIDFINRITSSKYKQQHAELIDRLLFHLGYLTLDFDYVSTLWEVENIFTNQVLNEFGFKWSQVKTGHIEKMINGCPDPLFFQNFFEIEKEFEPTLAKEEF